ncbi:hypothetical protein SEA_PETTERN_80 [Mycobacterium phage PetterN]|uniref:Uncharacterized protein n=2 Tax=Benedictvirus TaxID=2946819 RepID=A0A482J8N7_9CAUD|nr:hypothetical protein AVV06_gp19 [Mycobacterium phage Chadwick]YP_010060786.1 hypothetical protein KIP49_gp17 [Mycobacterium phage Scorpia]ALA06803.1 hypothetical protein SEA_CHADWICK_76 [Mycobacterium phage Chadwick]QBP29074.1 hypothetical protein SEA_SCORPIA_75 [Mycobacterium phage Scorpia]QGJ97124.1 hypothetical protein SEA_PETTERN_80 [Mycobacterium phage PetterN]
MTMIDLKLAAELKDKMPSIDQHWKFSSGPGWYLSDGEYPMFWDGDKWHDPAGDMEEHITEIVLPHLEEMFRLGFVAGLQAAKQDSEPE